MTAPPGEPPLPAAGERAPPAADWSPLAILAAVAGVVWAAIALRLRGSTAGLYAAATPMLGGASLVALGIAFRRDRSLALVRFVALLGGVAAFAWLALAFSGWSWSVAGATLEAIEAGGTAFYLPWLVLLVSSLALAPRHALPDLVRPALRSWPDCVATLVAVGVSAWLYRHGIERAVEAGSFLPALTPALVSGALFAPLVEEWLFRGLLWRQLAPPGASTAASVAALLATSATFGYWHLPFHENPPLHVHTAFGLAMGLLRWRTGSLLPCIVLHGAGNALAFL